jgi:hypothetical protein
VSETARQDNVGATGWHWFLAWAAVGAAGTLAFLGAMSVGIFVAPFMLVGAWLVGRSSRGAEVLGLVLGAGLLCLAIGYGIQGRHQCGSQRREATRLEPGEPYSCIEAEGSAWFVAGGVLGVFGVGGYSLARYLRSR